MPCYDERNSPSYIYENDVRPLQQKVEKLEAVLCGIFTQRSGPQYNGAGIAIILDQLDYKKMGVTRKWIEDWWKNHQAEDKRREAREAAAARARVGELRNKLISAEEMVRTLKKELGE